MLGQPDPLRPDDEDEHEAAAREAARKVDSDPNVNARLRKSARRNIGSATRRSTRTKATNGLGVTMLHLRRLKGVDNVDPCSDHELLADKQYPAESFGAFYRRHVGAVIRFVAARGADAETAADVVAETFAVALAKRGRYRARYPTARPWLLGIAARELANVRRTLVGDAARMERLARESIALTGEDHESYAALLATPIDVKELLGELSEKQRSAIAGRILEEQDYAEVARTLGMSEPATRKAVSRGLAALRAQLERKP